MNWKGFATEQPALAGRVRARFESARHHVLATLRKDGAPRVSGTEVVFQDPELLLGMMPGSAKARDLIRDPRFALHAHTGDGSMAGGDAKIAGIAEEIDSALLEGRSPEDGTFHLFRLEITRVALTSLNSAGDRLVIEAWRPGEPIRRVERA